MLIGGTPRLVALCILAAALAGLLAPAAAAQERILLEEDFTQPSGE